MLTIDIHTHILPETWPDLAARYGYPGFIELVHHKPGCARMEMDGTILSGGPGELLVGRRRASQIATNRGWMSRCFRPYR